MMISLAIALSAIGRPISADTVLDQRRTYPGFTVEYRRADSAAAASIAAALVRGRPTIETFFGAPFRARYVVRVYPDRASLTEHWAAAWGVPGLKTECWMVASGVAGELAVLSTRAWATEACEHDPAETGATDRLLWHEQVHVYHGQANPRPNFDGLDDLGWFIEGLAVLASRQLATEHRSAARAAVEAGKAPAALATAWSGRWRYGVAGSLVEYVDRLKGRRTVVAMLADTSNAALLARVGLGEADLLSRWRAALTASQPGGGRR